MSTMNSPTETSDADALRRPVRARMTDGRELLYFFDHPDQHEDFIPPADRRELPDRPAAARLRRDPLTGEWVSFAAHRQGRTHLPPADECPLCASGTERSTEVAATEYDVVVFENRFPSFGPGQQEQERSDAMGRTYPAEGRCEVIAFGSDHGDSFGDLGSQRARTVVEVWAQRTAELSALPGVEQVFAFENRGAQIGVTLHHPHGQIYSYPYVTPRTLTQLDQAQRHREKTGRNLMQDVLDFEVAEGTRIVERTDYFTVFVPFAARMPIEVHVVPNRHVADLAGLTGEERADLAEVYLRLIRGVDALYSTPTPYIAAWFQAPVRHPAAGELRLHLQLTSPRRAEDKLKYLAGSEAAMGAFIADVTPETTAERMRAALGTLNGATA